MPVIRMSDPEHFAHRPRVRRARAARIGDRVKNTILKKTGVSVPCSDCQSDISQMNKMTPEEVREQLETFVDRIFLRASGKAHRWHQRLAVRFAPEYVKSTIRGWIVDAIEAAEKDAPDRHSDGVGRPRQP